MQSDPLTNPVADPVNQPLDDPGEQVRPLPGGVPDADPVLPGGSPDDQDEPGRTHPRTPPV